MGHTIYSLDWHIAETMRHLPLLTAERGCDRTGCALLRRLAGVWLAPLSPRNETLDSENAPHHTRLATLNSFLAERDRRGTITLPARFIDQSFLLLARLLVHDSGGDGHRVRSETKTEPGEPKIRWHKLEDSNTLVILRYTLSAEYRRRKQTEIASLCRELGLRIHAPHQLRIDIDIHGRRVVDGVILPFLR